MGITFPATLQKYTSPKLIAAFLAITAIFVLAAGSVANAHSSRYPDYFGVEKPGDTSVCEGGSWEHQRKWGKSWKWNWGHDWGWWHHKKTWVPAWEKLGFESYGQCIRFVSTDKPTSKEQCKQEWWQLGFDSRRDCRKYLRLFPGGGYGG